MLERGISPGRLMILERRPAPAAACSAAAAAAASACAAAAAAGPAGLSTMTSLRWPPPLPPWLLSRLALVLVLLPSPEEKLGETWVGAELTQAGTGRATRSTRSARPDGALPPRPSVLLASRPAAASTATGACPEPATATASTPGTSSCAGMAKAALAARQVSRIL